MKAWWATAGINVRLIDHEGDIREFRAYRIFRMVHLRLRGWHLLCIAKVERGADGKLWQAWQFPTKA